MQEVQQVQEEGNEQREISLDAKNSFLVVTLKPNGAIEFCKKPQQVSGLSDSEGESFSWMTIFHPQDAERVKDELSVALRTGEPLETEARLRRADGEYRWYLMSLAPLEDEDANIVKWHGTKIDIEERKRAEVLFIGENRLLRMIARGDTHTVILDGLCRLVEEVSDGAIASILLLDPNDYCLRHGAAPSLPQSYIKAIDGGAIGPIAGSCGTAAYRNEPVIVSDIATNPLWLDYRGLALAHGLLACWSTPIRSSEGRVLGTFAIYSRKPLQPAASLLEILEQTSHLASIAIERTHTVEKLRANECELRRLIDAVPHHIFVLGANGECLYTNQVAREYHGLTLQDPEVDHLAMFVHADDRERALKDRQQLISRGAPYEMEARLLGKDQQYHWFLIRACPLRDEEGRIIRWYGTRTDIDDRKRAEENLRHDERELRQITDAIPQLISVLGPSGDVLYANELVLEYSGLTREDVMADDFRARLFHPDDLERLRQHQQKAFERGVPFELELRARRKDGRYRWFLIRYNPLRDEEGQIIRWYATGTDIQERKEIEERTQNENLALREEIDHSSMFEEIVGSSPVLRKVLTQVAKVAPLDSTVLILGETGTGKELMARAIHKRSKRASRGFIHVNCAAIPHSLIASELFGHEKGAFTGALQRRLGRFELADGGTIFLDEIGELPAETQIALLRVLQDREIERLGSGQSISVDVRVVAATNRDLKTAVAKGAFRQDLYYRLNVFPIQVPSLRERADDIPLLVEYLIERYAKKAGKTFRSMRKKTLELFQSYDWPGNIRELQNVIERAVILCESETFSVDETWLKPEGHRSSGPAAPLGAMLVERERDLIETALADCGGKVAGLSGAAAKLGIPRQTLESKINSLGIDKHRFRTRPRA